MKRNQDYPYLALVALCLLYPTASHALSLMLDFGPTLVQPADATNAPGHAVGAIPLNQITWNRITGDTNVLYYSDGTAATGVDIDIGRSTAVGTNGSDIITFSDNGFSVSALGGVVSGGIYANTSPIKDGIFGGSGGGNNLAVGIRVNGLAAGTYTIFVHGRNTSAGGAAGLIFYATNGPSAASYAFTTNDATAVVLNTAPAITNGFVQGNNFGVLTVTLGSGDSLYVASEGTVAAEMRGFMNAIQIFAGVPVLPAKVSSQPQNRSIYEGVTTTLTAGFTGTPPLFSQWRLNGTNLVDGPNFSGVNSNVLTLKNTSVSMAGNYTVFVTNNAGQSLSSNAVVNIAPILNTEQMTNIWNLSAGDRPYLGTGGTERGLAYNPTTTNLVLVSRLSADPDVIVLDALTGAEKHHMSTAGIPTSVAGQSLGLNTVGVADDGAVYGASVTINASSPLFYIYKWPDDSSSSVPVTVFQGDPALSVQPNQAWTDSMIVRGSGADTQILLAPRAGTNIVLLRTISGLDFQTEIPPTVIAVSNVPSAFARYGLAWGPGTNTFWAKTIGGQLYLIQFDLNSSSGAVLGAFSTALVPGAVRGLGTDKNNKFLAGVMLESLGDNVRLFDTTDLVSGPILRDQEAFSTQNANVQGTAAVSFGGNHLFALDSDNGIKAFLINTNYVPPSVTIVSQPTSRTAMEGATITFTAAAASSAPLTYQWKFNGTNNVVNGPNVSGANTNVLILTSITTNSAGNYSLFVSNVFGNATSSNALLTVLPTFNTPQMSNIWNLLPGERTYLGTNGTERSIAYNNTSTNLLLVSRGTPDPTQPTVVVLNPATGAEKHFLDTTGIPGTTPGVSLGLNTIAVSDDGVVFGASVTVSATSPPFNIYRWANDNPLAGYTLVFAGDPAASVQPNLRWTDAMTARGSGSSIEILVSPGSGTNVAILRSTSGLDFQTEIPPAIIAVSNVPSGFAQMGVAFGPGTNTFWAKQNGGLLYLIQYDINALTGSVLRSYDASYVPGAFRWISTDKNQKFMAGISVDASDTVRLYDISDLNAGPIWRDQEIFITSNPNITIGGTGSTAIGGGYVFGLDSNNGLKAFLINTNYVPPLSPFPITSVLRDGGTVVLTWNSQAGRTYQVQSRDSISTGSWGNLGGPISATGSTTSFTNTISSDTRFYRVGGQ